MCMFYWLLFGIFFDTKYNKNTKGNAKLNKAIIFDLDGTLWDSTGCASDIWNRVLEKHEDISFRMTQEMAAKLMGKTMAEIGAILFPEMLFLPLGALFLYIKCPFVKKSPICQFF